MKNNEVYQALLDLEKENMYVVTNEGFFNHLGVNLTKYDHDKEYIRLSGYKQKCYLKTYLNYRLGKVSTNKQKSNKLYFTADFETTTDKQIQIEKEIAYNEGKEYKEKTRIWAYGLTNIYDTNKFNYGTSLDDFMNLVNSLQNANIYFHNLKHDGSFILSYFLEKNIQHVEREELKENTYTCHIANGQYYSITWCLSDKSKGNRQNKITFYDSYKIMPTSIKSLGESFAKDLQGQGKVSVEEEFYHRYRPIDHKLTDEEIEYLEQDCKVAAIAMKFMLDLGHSRTTIGSNAFADFKTRFNKDFKYNYDDHFPVLPMGKTKDNQAPDDKGQGWNSWIIKAYRGGYTYVPKKYRGKDIGKGVVFDVNSLYPYCMYTDNLLPYGTPIWFNGNYHELKPYEKRTRPLFIQKIRTEFTIKENHLPIIPDKSKARKFADYLESSNGKPMELYLTNIDLQLFIEHYEIEYIDYIGGYCFKGKTGIFKEYIEYWREVKIKADQEGNEGLRYIAKLFLNSLYGKFATRWDKPASNPTLKNDILRFEKKYKWDDLNHEEQEESYIKQVKYPAMAVFITSYARKIMIEAAQKNFDRFRYCDTDSLHLEGEEFPTNIPIDHNNSGELGLWKHECTFDRARFIRSKTYIEEYAKKGKPKQLHVTVSGMSKSCHPFVQWDTFHEYKEDRKYKEKGYQYSGPLAPAVNGLFWGNIRPKVIQGGTILLTDFYIIQENQ
jgi:hypothetical protein